MDMEGVLDPVRKPIPFSADHALSSKKEIITTLSSYLKVTSLFEGDGHFTSKVISVLEKVCISFSYDDSIMLICVKFAPTLLNHAVKVSSTVDIKSRVLNLLEVLTYNRKADLLRLSSITSLVKMILKKDSLSPIALNVLTNIMKNSEEVAVILLHDTNFKSLMELMYSTGLSDKISCQTLEASKFIILMRPVFGDLEDDTEDDMYIKATFETVLKATDRELFRTVDFFLYFVSLHKNSFSGKCSNGLVAHFMEALKEKIDNVKNEDLSSYFLFLRAIVKINDEKLYSFYPIMIEMVLKMKCHDFKCPQALELCCAVLKSNFSNDSILETLEELISQIIPKVFKFSPVQNISTNLARDLSAQLSLLRLVQNSAEIPKCLSVMKDKIIIKDMISAFLQTFFDDFVSDVSCSLKSKLFVTFLDMLSGLALHDVDWLTATQNLFLDTRILKYLSRLLRNGGCDEITTVLSLVTSSSFPGESMAVLAKCMACQVSAGSEYICENILIESNSGSSSSNDQSSMRFTDNESNFIEKKLDLTKCYQQREECLMLTIETSDKKLSAADLHIQALKHELFVLNQLRYSLEHELSCRKSSSGDVQKALKSVQGKIKNEVDEAALQFSTLSQEINDLKKTVCDVMKDLEEEKEKTQNLIIKNEELTHLLKEKENILHALQMEKVEFEEEVKGLNAQISKIKEEDGSKNSKIEKLESLFSQLEIENKEIRNEKSKTTAEYEEIKNALAKKEKELDELKRVQNVIYEMTGGKKRV